MPNRLLKHVSLSRFLYPSALPYLGARRHLALIHVFVCCLLCVAVAMDAPQATKSMETKQQDVSTAKNNGRSITTTTTTATAGAGAVKPEARRAEPSKPSSGWQTGAKSRERQDARPVDARAAPAKASSGPDAGSKGRGRGGRGPSRGGGRAKQAKPARAEATAPAAALRSPEGERQSENATEASTPAPTPQEAAERKEGQLPDLPSSMRKSPRSKEVRACDLMPRLRVQAARMRWRCSNALV